MTKQEATQIVFDRALAHLRKQGRKSIVGNRCAYRGNGGRMCAIGPEIVNYDPKFEGRVVKLIPADCLTLEAKTSGAVFLGRLQYELHDGLDDYRFPSKLEVAAQRLAAEFGLTYAEGQP